MVMLCVLCVCVCVTGGDAWRRTPSLSPSLTLQIYRHILTHTHAHEETQGGNSSWKRVMAKVRSMHPTLLWLQDRSCVQSNDHTKYHTDDNYLVTIVNSEQRRFVMRPVGAYGQSQLRLFQLRSPCMKGNSVYFSSDHHACTDAARQRQ